MLEASGVLRDKRAATHHSHSEILKSMGVQVMEEKTITDENVSVGGGGMSSRIDVGLMVRITMEEELAKGVGETLEYPPQSR